MLHRVIEYVERGSFVLVLSFMGLSSLSTSVAMQDIVALSPTSDYSEKIQGRERWLASLVKNPARTAYKNADGETVYAKRIFLEKTALAPLTRLTQMHASEFLGAVLAPTPAIAHALRTKVAVKADRPASFQERAIKLAETNRKSDRLLMAEARVVTARLAAAKANRTALKPKSSPIETKGFEIDPTLTASINGQLTSSGYASHSAQEQTRAVFDAILGETPKTAANPEIPLAAALEETEIAPVPRIKPEVVESAEPRPVKKKKHFWAYFKLPSSTLKKNQQRCLAAAIYFEARGEPEEGQAAVAQVVLNRVKNPTFPKTICGVVYHNKHMRNRCQFSFACDGIYDRIRDKDAWKKAVKIAQDVSKGRTYLEKVGDSTHYHATYVNPKWARKMKIVDRIGVHIFYRTKKGGWI